MEDKTGTIERTNGKVTIFAPTGRCEVEIKKQEDIVEKDTICNSDGAGTGAGAGNTCISGKSNDAESMGASVSREVEW
jgi:hypothetical protein